MTNLDVRVSTRAFRAALVAVLPHISDDKEDVFLTRVRVYVSPEYLVVTATDRFTAAMAWLPVVESTGEVGCFDMTETDVKQLLVVHRLPKEGHYTLRLGHDGKHIRATDVSGLFAGKSLRLEAITVDRGYPDVPRMISMVATARALLASPQMPPLSVVWGAGLARFTVAAKTYEDFLVIEATARPRALLVSCGSSFLGVLIPTGTSSDPHTIELEHQLRATAVDVASVAALGHPTSPPKGAAVDVEDLGDLIPPAERDEKAAEDG